MDKETKNQIIFVLAGIAVVVLGIFAFSYENKPSLPVVGKNGEISGSYAIGGIMRLMKPYECTFEKTDEASKIVGVIHTDGENIYGEFRIRTDLTEKKFNSFLIVNKDRAYTWTSLQPTGFISLPAKSASVNASPQQQAQIIGLNDKTQYECELWQDVDSTIFEPPSWINFVNLK